MLFKNLFKTKITFYVLLVLFLSMFVDLPEHVRVSNQKVLNRLMPESFDALYEENSFSKIPEYIQYFNQVISLAQIESETAHAIGLKAYCNLKIGNDSMGITLLEQAINQKPHFFWYSYNLAATYFKQGNDARTIEILEPLLESDVILTIQELNSSKLYYQLINQSRLQDVNFLRNLEQGILDAYQMIWYSYQANHKWQELFESTKKYAQKSLAPSKEFDYYQSLALAHLNNLGQTKDLGLNRIQNQRPLIKLKVF